MDLIRKDLLRQNTYALLSYLERLPSGKPFNFGQAEA
jgi:hypothetical protein